MQKITLEGLIIEPTRRCNMRCRHCCRGDAQDVDLDPAHIDTLLDQVEVIGALSFFGGEPTLCTEIMDYTWRSLCKHGIPVFNVEIVSNGLIYDEKLVRMMKNYKRLIDISHSQFTKLGYGYLPEDNCHRCRLMVSLDRYHEDHALSVRNYERYKAALTGYSDVLKKLSGNLPFNFGRAKNLPEASDVDYQLGFKKRRRVELFSKDFQHPACKKADTYRLSYDDQKIVCCSLYLTAHGKIVPNLFQGCDYDTIDGLDPICTAGEPLWDALLEYNSEREPCAENMRLSYERGKELGKLRNIEDIVHSAFDPELHDEESSYAARRRRLLNPKSITEALTNFASEYRKYTKIYRSAPESDKREMWNPEGLYDAIQLATKKLPLRAAEMDDNGIRCCWCGKVIRHQGRNIHCTPGNRGLVCEYCGRTTKTA